MAKITFIIGLCGSGKTYLSDQLSMATGVEVFESLVEKQDTDIPKLLQCLRDGQDCVVEEISFCTADTRGLMMRQISQHVPECEVEWMCYENDLESANWNVTHRINKGEIERHIEINGRVHQSYSYPDGCTLLPITRIPTRV